MSKSKWQKYLLIGLESFMIFTTIDDFGELGLIAGLRKSIASHWLAFLVITFSLIILIGFILLIIRLIKEQKREEERKREEMRQLFEEIRKLKNRETKGGSYEQAAEVPPGREAAEFGEAENENNEDENQQPSTPAKKEQNVTEEAPAEAPEKPKPSAKAAPAPKPAPTKLKWGLVIALALLALSTAYNAYQSAQLRNLKKEKCGVCKMVQKGNGFVCELVPESTQKGSAASPAPAAQSLAPVPQTGATPTPPAPTLVTSSTAETKPKAPAKFKAAKTEKNDIALSWEYDGNNNNIEGFVLLRNGKELATLSPDIKNFTDENLFYYNSYCYSIYAYKGELKSSEVTAGCVTLTQPPSASSCGDGICNNNETQTSCPTDCHQLEKQEQLEETVEVPTKEELQDTVEVPE